MTDVTDVVEATLASMEREFRKLCIKGDMEDTLIQRVGWYIAAIDAIKDDPCNDPDVQRELLNRMTVLADKAYNNAHNEFINRFSK